MRKETSLWPPPRTFAFVDLAKKERGMRKCSDANSDLIGTQLQLSKFNTIHSW